jgi:hypothetical protein
MATKTLSKPKSKIFKSNLQKVKENYDKEGSGDWWKPRDGKNVIRILPPWGESADGSFYLKGALHYGFSIGGRDRALACLEAGGRGKCPVCIVVEKAKGNEDQEKFISRVRAKYKYWVNIIDRKSPDKVMMYALSKKAWKLIAGPMADEDDPVDATDPDEGYDMIIEKEGSGMQTRYQERMRPKASTIGTDTWMDNLHDLDKEVFEWMTYAEMVKHLKSNFGDVLAELGIKFGGDTKKKDEDEDDDDEEEPKKKSKKVAPKAKKEVKSDEDEDDEEEDEDEDEDDE